jgi:hypothetical protein
MAGIFGGVPKRVPLLSDRLELTQSAFTDFPELSQQAGVFSLDATVIHRNIGQLPLPHCAEDDGLYVSPFPVTMADGRARVCPFEHTHPRARLVRGVHA